MTSSQWGGLENYNLCAWHCRRINIIHLTIRIIDNLWATNVVTLFLQFGWNSSWSNSNILQGGFGLFQLQMRIPYPFLLAKYLSRFLLIMRNSSFLTFLYIGGTYARLVYTWYKNIFHVIAVLIVFLAVNENKVIWWKNAKTRQRIDRDETVLLLATR